MDVNTKDSDWNDRTPLHWACMKGRGDIVQLLLDNKADPNLLVGITLLALFTLVLFLASTFSKIVPRNHFPRWITAGTVCIRQLKRDICPSSGHWCNLAPTFSSRIDMATLPEK